jgi:predicted HicB family RNase H-like nuclease
MNNLEYKGYFGSIEYSKEDNCYYGNILGMQRDSISYEGNSVEELESDFKNAIESYLEGCKELEIKPRKGYNGFLNIRIPAETHSRIAIYAKNHGTSINSFIRETIEKRLEVADY